MAPASPQRFFEPRRRVTTVVMRMILLALTVIGFAFAIVSAGSPEEGSMPYDRFDTPKYCGTSCHTDIYHQWTQSMMSHAYTHHWDEIEYFELAVPHSERDPKVAEVKAGCNGCHSPLAYLNGGFPPPRPAENSRANESVSCEVCHTITGITEDTAYNFNFVWEPGEHKYGPRSTGSSPAHKMIKSNFLDKTEFCGGCHNEKSPYGIWVKSTQLEWLEGPYAQEDVRCHDCHMTYAPMVTASMGPLHQDARLHLFHGAHDNGKLSGVVELRIYPDLTEAEPGDKVTFTVVLFNQKTGHKFPTGSVEDRLVWLHVEARDATGTVYHLPVDRKDFEGEEYTIGADILAYQDMGIALDKPNFEGVARDGIPVGDRIFRMPYFDPQGRMTIQQWNTASLGVDYRIGPRETKIETCTFELPYDVSPGNLTVTATLNYQLLVGPVGEFLGVPEEETTPFIVNEQSTTLTVLP